MKRIIFLTGTRADFGKMRSLIDICENNKDMDVHVYCTGMHLVEKYGYTINEIRNRGYRNITTHKNESPSMDGALASTIQGFSDCTREVQPDLIVVHGDRVEALAGAAVGALNNIPVAHIEGGEVSGAVDESIRHAVSKLSHLHFVTNSAARRRLEQLGENPENIFVIGSPDVDAIMGPLPDISEVRARYDIGYCEYAVVLLHPVTTDIEETRRSAINVVNAAKRSGDNFVVIYPNNDYGTEIIQESYKPLREMSNFKIIPSMRFECFLSLLKHAQYMLGNSSSALMEAPNFGVPAVNIGTRQNGRMAPSCVFHCDSGGIADAIKKAKQYDRLPFFYYGYGGTAEKFFNIIKGLKVEQQKVFFDHD
ncbi:MAG: UDP-N-acetylglucosamine 2-epimerase [Exilibacterium sp.]